MLLSALLSVPLVHAGEADAAPPKGPEPGAPRVWIGIGLTGAAASGDPAGGGGGTTAEVGARLGREPRRSLALAGRVHEAVAASPLREIGNIEFQVQYPSGAGPYALVGFTHNHEAAAEDWLADPVGVTAGTSKAITHRSGFEAGAGWAFGAPFPEVRGLNRFQPSAAVTAHVFPDAGGPTLYVVGELGLRFGLDGLFGRRAPAG